MKVEIQFKDFECLLCGYINDLPKHVDETFEQARQHALTMHADVLRLMLLPRWLETLAIYAGMPFASNLPLKIAGRIWARIVKPEGPL